MGLNSSAFNALVYIRRTRRGGYRHGNQCFRYQKSPTKYDCSEENIKRIVPLTARQYRAKFGGDDELDAMREVARVPMQSKGETDKFKESIQIAAGIK